MSLTAKIVLWLLLSTFAVCAQAYDIEEGVGVICDELAQIERFANLDAQLDAIRLINTDAQKNVCAQASVHYIWGREVGRVMTAKGSYQIVEILLLEAHLHGAWISVTPQIQYTLFNIEERRA